MNLLLRQPGIKPAAVRLFALFSIIILAVFVLASAEMNRISSVIADQNTAMLGKIISEHPELEAEAAGFITAKASPSEVEAGRRVLSRYGYGSMMPALLQPVFSGYNRHMEFRAAAFAAFCFFPLLALLCYEYRRIYSRVNMLSDAAEKVVDGKFEIVFPPDRDNSFSILYHCFKQMSNRIKLGMEKLKDDKLFLRNMMSDISHQLKTPLSSLIMFNELMLDDLSMPVEMREMFLAKGKRQLERIEWLVQSLLKMARLESGSIGFRKERILLSVPARNAAASMSIRASEKRIRIIFEGDTDNVRFTGDEEWMTEALSNIIKNSIEHTGDNGEIRISFSETPLFSRVTIADNGEGIDKKDIPHIFERFYRSSSSLKPESVGIGLALTKLLIEGQDGSITVKSEVGKGTEMIITFLKY